MPKSPKKLDKISARDAEHRIVTATRLAMLFEEQGKEHDPDARNQKVEQQIKQIETVIKEQVAKGEALAQQFKEKGSDPLNAERAEIEKILKEAENSLHSELQAISALDETYNFSNLIEREKEARKARKKRTKVVQKPLGSGLQTK